MHSTPSFTLPVNIGLSTLCPQTLPHLLTAFHVSLCFSSSFLLFIVKVKLMCNSNVEDLCFLFFFFSAGWEEMRCVRWEGVMVALLSVERVTLSRCSQADVHRERTLPSPVQETMNTVFLTIPPIQSCFFILKKTTLHCTEDGREEGRESESEDKMMP